MKFFICTSAFQSQVADLLPCNNGQKSQLIYTLLRSYKLLEHFNDVIGTSLAGIEDMKRFHSEKYLKLILNQDYSIDDQDSNPVLQLADIARRFYQNSGTDVEEHWFDNEHDLYRYYAASFVGESDEDTKEEYLEEVDSELLEKYGLQHDCPLFPYLSMYVQVITGATLSLLQFTQREVPSIAINWDGGRHHALKEYASGFCYVNDIVLLIQSLRRKGWNKVTYVDFDLHHGDGVAKALQFSKNIQTISVHLYESGFFPGTGSLNETRNAKEMVNVPVLHGMDDEYLKELMCKIVNPLVESFDADCIVIQCGADGLGGDKYNEWQLTIGGLTQAIISVMRLFKHKQIFLLGGGGYNPLLVARFYTFLTAKVLETFGDIPCAIDENDEDLLIRDHEFIELYEKENYRYWSYDNEGELKRGLRNDNKKSYVQELKEFYHL